ncbi:HlyD family efflux transporter periplasmic adaptor subunit [Streptomyces sp. NPDC127084]|uniref:HlyD family efflux transporter periplasmic adaptor subunit n=1 Tax=Streptomyces sp. NPDC127084 TaxID=3347133 RepID=UPI003657A380
MQFRQKALSKLQSPEEIDLPVRFARPQGWLVLSVTVVAMAAACVWAVKGSVSSTVSAPGILTHAQGSYVLQSPVGGQITEVLAAEGKRLPAGAPLLKVRTAEPPGAADLAEQDTDGASSGTDPGPAPENGGTPDKDEDAGTVIRTLAAGRVTALAVGIGAVITTGADVAVMERVDKPSAPLRAMLYVPPDNGSAMHVGAQVDLTVQSVPAQRYGVLRGRVEAVGRTPQTSRQIAGFLGDGQLADQFNRQGRPLAVLVRLEPSSDAPSGYRWSSQDGPPHALDSMTLLTGAVRVADQQPIDWLLP